MIWIFNYDNVTLPLFEKVEIISRVKSKPPTTKTKNYFRNVTDLQLKRK